jgi:hypothetical protein
MSVEFEEFKNDFFSTQQGNLENAKLLVERGASINKQSKAGCTAFYCACLSGQLAVGCTAFDPAFIHTFA